MSRWMRVGVVVAVGIVLAMVNATVVTWAQEAGHFRAGGAEGEWHGAFAAGQGRERGARLLAMLDNDRVKTALGLTEDQTGRLRQIVLNTEKANIKTRAEVQVRGIELRELLRADNPDRDALMKKIDEISALRTAMAKQDVDALLQAKSVLTPEQQKKIRTFLEMRHAGMGMGERNFRFHGEGGRPPAMGVPRTPVPPQPDAPPQQP